MDARKLTFESDTFGVVSIIRYFLILKSQVTREHIIDKGTTDAILCGKSGFSNVKEMYTELCRVLCIGIFLFTIFFLLNSYLDISSFFIFYFYY